MGRKSYTRLKLLLLICGFMGLTVLPFATSYSHATISNAASVKITDQANALIAVQLASSEECFLGDTVSGKVINNMGVPIGLSPDFTDVRVFPKNLSEGATATLSFDVLSHSGVYAGEIHATWHNGSARIPYSVNIAVVDPSDLHVYWDEIAAEITVTNSSDLTLEVVIGNRSETLTSGSSSHFHRTGDTTAVTFFLGQRAYTVSISTLLPLSPVVPATPEIPPADQSLVETSAWEQETPETLDNADENQLLSEQPLTEDDEDVPSSNTEFTEVIIEP